MASAFKILSDFDGVWTNQEPEAAAVRRHVTAELARLSGSGVDAVEAHVERFLAVVHSAPHEHGWAPQGRITAYVDEDPLCDMSSMTRYMAQSDDPDARTYVDAVVNEFASMAEFTERCFQSATSTYRREHPSCLVDHAGSQLAALRDAGAEVVIISNSPAEKIAAWLREAGIDAGAEPGHSLRVRGMAAKWHLGGSDQSLEIGGRSVFVDRPHYREAIEAEAPDLVIGDVFSLDLALPHVMRSDGHSGAPRQLVLRRQAHTPSWILDDRAGGAIDAIVDSIGELARLVEDGV